jgi:glycosyltransferase involved in cell wall biosynthesis
MKVLQVHAGYRLAAGEDTVVANEAAALRAGGHEVEQFIVPNPTGAVASVAALARSAHNRSIGRRFEQVVDSVRPDLVHVHNTWFAISPAPVQVAASRSIPVVMTLHNYRLGCLSTDLFRAGDICTACVGRSPLSGVVHGCYRDSRALSAIQATEVMVTRRRRVLVDGVARFVAPSAFMGERLVDIGVPADRLVVKPHFTDDPGPRTGTPSASREVLFVGRLAPGKGLESLLDAWGRSKASDDLDLVVLGDGPLLAELRAAAPPSVRFDGWQSHDDVVRRLLAARSLVFPSEWYEPFGMVLIEALSAGLPIATSNASAAATIAGSPDALVFPSRDTAAMAATLDLLLDDATVDTEGSAARHRYETSYDARAGLAALESLYDDVRGPGAR